MTTALFSLCAVPEMAWKQMDNPMELYIGQFTTDALGCERRIAKEVNLENEFDRYTLTCQRLEQAVLGSGRLNHVQDHKSFCEIIQTLGIPMQVLSADYLTLLSRVDIPATWARLGASFFLPEMLTEHIHAFTAWATQQGMNDNPVVLQRTQFYKWAANAECGVVEVQTHFRSLNEQTVKPMIERYTPSAVEDNKGYVEIPDFETTGLSIEFFGQKDRKQHLAEILRQQIRDALASGEPITFGNQAPHDVIAQVLHEFVFVAPDAVKPTKLRVAYVDGSEASPFPVFCLPRSETIQDENVSVPLRVALMSMRHVELDPQIDYCWFRNREVSRTRTLAETDQFCFDTTLDQIKDSLALGDLAIHMYQTGFEPAVVGFYRGVTRMLVDLHERKSTPRLSVIPFFFRGSDNYQMGSTWA